MVEIVYKIRRKSDGMFSAGGERPSFSKKGKIWRQRGHVSNHLAQMTAQNKQLFYNDCEIIEFEVVETEISNIDVADWQLMPNTIRAKELAAERSREFNAKWQAEKIKRLEAELRDLKK